MRQAPYEDYQLKAAIDAILRGICDKMELSDGTKVYKVKNIIRVDIKIKEE